MIKNKLYIVVAACFVIIFAVSASALILCQERTLSEKDFLLEVDLDKNVFNVAEKITFTATITNKSGKDVNMSSNGEMPCVFFHNVNDTIIHVEGTLRVDKIFKANEKISRIFEYEVEAGSYVLDVHYRIVVDDIAIQHKIEDIIIEVR